MSQIQQLLMERTVAILMQRDSGVDLDAPFIVVQGMLLGIQENPRVQLTAKEFLECSGYGGLAQ